MPSTHSEKHKKKKKNKTEERRSADSTSGESAHLAQDAETPTQSTPTNRTSTAITQKDADPHPTNALHPEIKPPLHPRHTTVASRPDKEPLTDAMSPQKAPLHTATKNHQRPAHHTTPRSPQNLAHRAATRSHLHLDPRNTRRRKPLQD